MWHRITLDLSFHTAAALCAPDLSLVHSEVVRNLVPNGVRNHLLQLFFIASQALVRGLVNRNLIWHDEAVANAALGERPSMILTQKTWSGRVLFHDDRHIVQPFPESGRDAPQRVFD
jgi:hypothetical protein